MFRASSIREKKHNKKLAGINLSTNHGQPMQHVTFLPPPLFVLRFIFVVKALGSDPKAYN